MHYAMTSHGRKVAASDSDARAGQYCPACGGSVSLVRAYDKRDHFRHQPYSASDGCPLYNPHDGYWDGTYVGASYNRPSPPWARLETKHSNALDNALPTKNKYGIREYSYEPNKDNSSKNNDYLTKQNYHIPSKFNPIFSVNRILKKLIDFAYDVFVTIILVVRITLIPFICFLITFAISNEIGRINTICGNFCGLLSFLPVVLAIQDIIHQKKNS